ncbi:hypothetical protein HDU76_006864 [Blyttiomyces sp. JEL0837]|nr:hypothetical protein HDU76_006864 [Blyttiomyces sp. JEL0837]
MKYDVATGSLVTASSTYNSGSCANNNCGVSAVIDNPVDTDIDTTQWVSAPGSCDPNRNESLMFDWSPKYNTQLLSEVRFRYGDLDVSFSDPNPKRLDNFAAGSVSLVLYSEIPMNIPDPTAVTYENNASWQAFVFTEPVTASGMQLTWSNLGSKDGGNTCFATVAEVQAWTGASPDPLPAVQPTPKAKGMTSGTIAAIILIPIALMIVAAILWVLKTRRANIIRTRLAREVELRRKQASKGFVSQDSEANAIVTSRPYDELHDNDTASISDRVLPTTVATSSTTSSAAPVHASASKKGIVSPRIQNFLNAKAAEVTVRGESAV